MTYSGDVNNTPVSACGGTGQTLTVNAVAPSITTRADPAMTTVGAWAADQATFTGLVNPATSTGTITWKLYAASDTSCTGMVSFTSSPQKVTANTTYTSSSFTTTSVGTYQWGFTYTGDANNHPVATCGGANESLTVNPATPHVITNADPATTTVGGSVADQASFTGLVNPASSSGTVSWALYRSTDSFLLRHPGLHQLGSEGDGEYHLHLVQFHHDECRFLQVGLRLHRRHQKCRPERVWRPEREPDRG